MLFTYHHSQEALSPSKDPLFEIALEEALCLYFARFMHEFQFSGGMRIWSNPYSIVLGRTCQWERVLRLPPKFHPGTKAEGKNTTEEKQQEQLEHLRQNIDIPICRRLSGGGTVLHGPGNWNYSIFLSLKHYPQMFAIDVSYRILLDMVRDALQAQGIHCQQHGQSDLALMQGRQGPHKISGSAQFRHQGILVFHGTLLANAQIIRKITKYLAHPPKQPEYRQHRSHNDFLTCLPPHFDPIAFFHCLGHNLHKHKMIAPFAKQIIPFPDRYLAGLYALVRKLIDEKYSQAAWTLQGKTKT